MKMEVFDVHGKKAKQMEMPDFFMGKIREDLIAKVLEAKKIKQAYAPSPLGGNQHSASGKFSHRRHVWKTLYGKGISRIPRKIFSRSGSQFNMAGATIPSTRGGRRAHPPKILHMLTRHKINKGEMNLAFISALRATASPEIVSKKYATLRDEKIKNLPIVIETSVLKLKTKDFLKMLKEILGEKIFNVAVRKKVVRAGVGKLRGRKYKENAGLLIVKGKKEKANSKLMEVATAENLSVNDLAQGGFGRLVIYTEEAIRELEKRFTNSPKKSQIKELNVRLKEK